MTSNIKLYQSFESESQKLIFKLIMSSPIPVTRRPYAYLDYPLRKGRTPSTLPTPPVTHIPPDPLLHVHEAQQYVKEEMAMQLKLKNIQDNIDICREKSQIKDKQMQALADMIDKLSKRVDREEQRLKEKEKQYQKLGHKCQEATKKISQGQNRANKEEVYLSEEKTKHSQLEDTIKMLHQQIASCSHELKLKQQRYQQLQLLSQDNQQLQERYEQLLNQEKMVEYRSESDKVECEQLQKKIDHLNKVLKDRNKINKNNTNKLNRLIKDVKNIEESLRQKQVSSNEAKALDLDIGDLNQELLLINDQIGQLEFKTKRKAQQVQELRAKINHYRQQAGPRQSTQKSQESPKQQANIVFPSRAPHKSNNQYSQIYVVQPQLTNETPSFPSQKDLNFNSEPPKVSGREEYDPNDKQAFKNIEKLIKRYEQIKNKDKLGQ